MNARSLPGTIALTGSLAAMLGLAACVNPSAKIASSLEGYGFQPAQSQCFGD